MLPEETVDYNIRKTWINIQKMYNKKANEYMGSASLAMIMLNIDMYEGTPSTKLGPIMGMEATSLSRSLNKLERIEVIYRQKDPNDKRKSIVHLTEKGRKRRSIAKEIVVNFNESVFSSFNKEEINTFFEILNKINEITYQQT